MFFINEGVLKKFIWFSVNQDIVWVSAVSLIVWEITRRISAICVVWIIAVIATTSTTIYIYIYQASAWYVFSCQYVFNRSYILLTFFYYVQNLIKIFPLILLLTFYILNIILYKFDIFIDPIQQVNSLLTRIDLAIIFLFFIASTIIILRIIITFVFIQSIIRTRLAFPFLLRAQLQHTDTVWIFDELHR